MAFVYAIRRSGVPDEVAVSVLMDGSTPSFRIRWSAALDRRLGTPARIALYVGEGEDAGYVQLRPGNNRDYSVERKNGRAASIRFAITQAGIADLETRKGIGVPWLFTDELPALTVDLRGLSPDAPPAKRDIPEFPPAQPIERPKAEPVPEPEAAVAETECPTFAGLWTPEEEDIVVNAVLDDIPLEKVSEQIGRTTAAIRTRIHTRLRHRIIEGRRKRAAVRGEAPPAPQARELPKPVARPIPAPPPIPTENGHPMIDDVLAWLRRDGVKAKAEGGGLYTVGNEKGQTANQVILAANLRRQNKSPALPPFPRLELAENLRR